MLWCKLISFIWYDSYIRIYLSGISASVCLSITQPTDSPPEWRTFTVVHWHTIFGRMVQKSASLTKTCCLVRHLSKNSSDTRSAHMESTCRTFARSKIQYFVFYPPPNDVLYSWSKALKHRLLPQDDGEKAHHLGKIVGDARSDTFFPQVMHFFQVMRFLPSDALSPKWCTKWCIFFQVMHQVKHQVKHFRKWYTHWSTDFHPRAGSEVRASRSKKQPYILYPSRSVTGNSKFRYGLEKREKQNPVRTEWRC